MARRSADHQPYEAWRGKRFPGGLPWH